MILQKLIITFSKTIEATTSSGMKKESDLKALFALHRLVEISVTTLASSMLNF